MAFDQGQYDLTAKPLSGGGTYGEGRIVDALTRLRSLQGALQSGDIDYATYQKLFSQFDPQALQLSQAIGGGGSKSASAANAAGAGQLSQLSQIGGSQDLGTFQSLFKNLTGKDAGAKDISTYFSTVAPELQALPGGSGNVQDVHTLINQFLSDQYQPQIQQYQKQQQTNALNDAQQQAQNLIQKQNQTSIDQLSSPKVMEQLKESMNGMGLLNSGAFSETLAGDLANSASANQSNALGQVTIPGINNMQGTANAPYQQFLGSLAPNTAAFGNAQQSQQNFQQQSSLAQELQAMMQPSTLSQLAPIIQGFEQGGGMAAQGGLAGTSAICVELMKHGLTTIEEVDALHWKILPGMFTRCRALDFYAKNGKKLVAAANKCGFDWSAAKPWFIDEPLACETWQETIDAYALACKRLADIVAPELWDERIMKPRLLDFFRFIIPVVMVRGYRMCYRDLFRRSLREVCYGRS